MTNNRVRRIALSPCGWLMMHNMPCMNRAPQTQPNQSLFDDQVQKIVLAVERPVVVGGYERPGSPDSNFEIRQVTSSVRPASSIASISTSCAELRRPQGEEQRTPDCNWPDRSLGIAQNMRRQMNLLPSPDTTSVALGHTFSASDRLGQVLLT